VKSLKLPRVNPKNQTVHYRIFVIQENHPLQRAARLPVRLESPSEFLYPCRRNRSQFIPALDTHAHI